MASSSASEKIRKKVAEIFGPAGVRFQTRDVTNSDLFIEWKGGVIGTALSNWVDNGMIVDGWALDLEQDASRPGSRKFWRLKYVLEAPAKTLPKATAKDGNKVAEKIGSEDVFAARIIQIKKDSMLVESKGKLYRVSPLDW